VKILVTITGIISGSPADKVGVKAGMLLISINGHSVRDVLDYMFYASETEVNLLIEDNHEQKTFHIEKEE
jgi:C-terminal processing protease CtpA/Prc